MTRPNFPEAGLISGFRKQNCCFLVGSIFRKMPYRRSTHWPFVLAVVTFLWSCKRLTSWEKGSPPRVKGSKQGAEYWKLGSEVFGNLITKCETKMSP